MGAHPSPDDVFAGVVGRIVRPLTPAAPGAATSGYRAGLAYRLGCIFFVTICAPALGELPGGLPLAIAWMLAALPIWFAAAATRRTLVLDRASRAGTRLILTCLTFLIGWAFLSVLDSEAPLEAGRMLTTLVAGFAMFLLVAGTVTRDRLFAYVTVLCAILAVTCVLSVVAYFEPNLRAVIFRGSDRASGLFKNPNQFGMSISTLLPVAVALWLGRPSRRGAWFLCLAALMTGLVVSGSKTNLLLSSLTLVFVLCSHAMIAHTGGRRVLMLMLSLLGTGVLLAANVLLLSVFNPRALSLLQQLVTDDADLQTLNARQELWRQSVEQFQRDPILGQGAGQPLEAIQNGQFVTHSHNVLLDYLRALGAPGFLVLSVVILTVLILCLGSIRLAFRAKTASPRDRILCIGLATGALAYVAANLSSDSMGPSTSPFFWAVLFLGLTARSLLQPEDAGARSRPSAERPGRPSAPNSGAQVIPVRGLSGT